MNASEKYWSQRPEEERQAALSLLREPFKPEDISLKPKPTAKGNTRGVCDVCGGYHGLPAVHLSYVGHAALTARLLDVDPYWQWEPMSTDEKGFPLLDSDNGMWIRLTICGITRYGYGDAEQKTGPDATKERIGDALRNGAMRFGAAIELWQKQDAGKKKKGKAEVKLTPEEVFNRLQWGVDQLVERKVNVTFFDNAIEQKKGEIKTLPARLQKSLNQHIKDARIYLEEEEQINKSQEKGDSKLDMSGI